MKLIISFTFGLFVLNAHAVKKNVFECKSQDKANEVAILTYETDGSGQILWEEPWHSATSIAEPNSSEEVGEIYELTDFHSDNDGGFQLIVSHDLADSRIKGKVEILYKGESQGIYFCN